MNLQHISTSVQTMSSREIAELTQKEHYNVKRDCNVMFSELELDALKFEGIYFDTQNRQQTEYLLTYELVQTLITGYSIKLRHAVIKRLNELEAKAKTLTELPVKPQAISSAFRSCMAIAKLAGLQGNQAILSADKATRKITGQSPLELLEVTHLTAPVNQKTLTPTEIGKLLTPNVSGRQVNQMLRDAGLQVKSGENWLPTEQGQKLSEMMNTGKKHGDGTPVKQMKWYQDVVGLLI